MPLPLQEALTIILDKEFRAKVVPKCKMEILFSIFNNPDFKALYILSLPNYIKEIVFAKLLEDFPSPFRLQFDQHFRQSAANNLNNALVCYWVSNILFNCRIPYIYTV